MKHFKSFLSPEIYEFIAYRKQIGYNAKDDEYPLFLFDCYVQKTVTSCCTLSPEFFIDFQNSLSLQSCTVNNIITKVRVFFNFLVRKGIYSTNPVKDVPRKKEYAYMPFIFSPEQTDEFLNIIERGIRKQSAYFFKDFTIYMIFLCIARCGLRISEPMKLKHEHYRRQEGTFYIEKTKFGKDRLIPVPKSVLTQVENYVSVQKKLRNIDNNSYLFSSNSKPVSKNLLYPIFHQALDQIGIKEARRQINGVIFNSPTTHSLRHSFAINTLKDIKHRGKSPQSALPILSAYMGHKKYRYTSVYLKFLDAEQRNAVVNFSISNQKDL